jgi:hypothetical protein
VTLLIPIYKGRSPLLIPLLERGGYGAVGVSYKKIERSTLLIPLYQGSFLLASLFLRNAHAVWDNEADGVFLQNTAGSLMTIEVHISTGIAIRKKKEKNYFITSSIV